MKKTPLFEEAVGLGARFTAFAGWDLPLYYSSIIEEHMAVRTAVGLFDISHLGKIFVRGPGAAQTLDNLATTHAGGLPPGKGAYALFCDDEGGVIDDEIVYHTRADEYLLLTNAARLDAMIGWLSAHNTERSSILDDTERLALLALQGPESPRLLESVLAQDAGSYARYAVREVAFGGSSLLVMKSGYTGEVGYEILVEAGAARDVWRAFLDAGARPAGLGARDTLRLEMGYALYGRELTSGTTPLEAGLQWAVAFDKDEFIGKRALQALLERGVDRTLTGIILDRGIARGDEPVFAAEGGDQVGAVTSGGFSPVLGKGICMAYLQKDAAVEGREVLVAVRGKRLTGRIKRPPFIAR